MSAKRTFGAASRSSPSLRWNSSRYSSGTSPTSRKESTWPSFMAAPFIVPSAATICSAASRWRRSSAAWLPRSSRVRFAAWVPSRRVPWPAASRATRAVRAIRDVGMRSLAMAAEGCQGAGVGVSAGGAAAGDGAAGVALGVGVGVGVALGAGVALGVGVPLGVGVALLSGVGVAFSLSLSVSVSLFAAAAEDGGARAAGGHGVAGGQLDERDDGGRGDEGEQAGDDGQPPLACP